MGFQFTRNLCALLYLGMCNVYSISFSVLTLDFDMDILNVNTVFEFNGKSLVASWAPN